MNVHFICRGNAHRSVMAEAYLKSLKIPNITVSSSGVVADVHRELNVQAFNDTREFLKKQGIGDYAKTYSDQLTQVLLNEKDVTVCVNQIAFDEGSLSMKFPGDTIIWDVSDTGEGDRLLREGDDPTKYDAAIFTQIKTYVDELIKTSKFTKAQRGEQ